MGVLWGYDVDLDGALTILSSVGYIDMNKTELRQAVIQNLAAAPSTPSAGQVYFDTSKADSVKGAGKFGYKAASQWVYPDMEKSVYDSNNDGWVDNADAADTLDGYHGAWYQLRDNHTGTQLASTISNFDEAAQDAVGSMLLNTNSITFFYNDSTNQMSANAQVVSGQLNISGSGIGLATSGVTAGTWSKITVDVYGRVTNGANLSAGDLPTHTHTASQVTDFDTAVRLNRLDQMAAPTGAVSMNSQRLTNLAAPQSANDAATMGYVDAAVQGLKGKDSVLCATTGNITLSGTQTIDGVSATAGKRVLVKNQTATAQNGIYIVSAGAWTRATDADAWNEIVSAYTWVEQGTTLGDTGWLCTVDSGGTLNTTGVTWTQFNGAGSITAGAGLTKSGNTLSVNVDNQSTEIVSGNVQAKLDAAGAITKSASGLKVAVDGTSILISGNQLVLGTAYKNKKVTGTITGTGGATSFNITHSLGTKDILIDVYEGTTGYTCFPLVERYDVNTAKFSFRTPPANGKVYNVVIIG